MPTRIGLLVAAWPQRDWAAWHRAITPVDYFDQEAVAAHWSLKTRYQAQSPTVAGSNLCAITFAKRSNSRRASA